MDGEHLHDRRRDGDARVERGVRVLEHDLDPLPESSQGSRGPAARTSMPSKTMRPASARTSRRIARPVVVLPLPDSPTSASVSPRPMVRLTPRTAVNAGAGRAGHLVPEAARLAEDHVQVLDPQQGLAPARRRWASPGLPTPRSWVRGSRSTGRASRRQRSGARPHPRPVARRAVDRVVPRPASPRARKSATAAMYRSGSSACARWPDCSNSTHSACGMRSAICSTCIGVASSWRPLVSSTGPSTASRRDRISQSRSVPTTWNSVGPFMVR